MADLAGHRPLLLLTLLLVVSRLSASATTNHSLPGFFPAEPSEYRVMIGGDSGGRRRLAPFQLCLLCKCCPANAAAGNCTSMPCCFGIDCQLPDKPFGVCAFVPKTCSCTTCSSAAAAP